MNRRRVVTGVRIVGVVAVCGLALLLAVRLQARGANVKLENEFCQKVGPLDPAAYASSVVPDAENAAIWLRAAAAALSLSKGDKDLVGDLSWVMEDRWTADQRTAIERVFSRNAPAFALAERASALPRSSYLLSAQQAVRVKPEIPLLDLLWLARTIDERARLAVNQGNWTNYRLGVLELACIGASLERESPFIAQLVGVAAERIMFDAILAGVREPTTSRIALQGLDATIPGTDLVTAWRQGLGYLGAGVHSGAIELRDMFPPMGQTHVAVSVPSPEEYLRIVLSIEGLAAKPLGLDMALVDRLEKSKQIGNGRPPADTLASSLVRYQSNLSLRRLARLALALRLEDLDQGQYPATLAAWPDASAPDPLTGGPLRYERRGDGSAVISVPGAEELFNKINELKTSVPFTWELPAPAKAVAKK